MAGCSAVRLLGELVYSTQWETLMTTSGFVNYKPASAVDQLVLLPYVAAIVVWTVSELAPDYDALVQRPRVVQAYSRALVVVGYGAVLGVIGYLACIGGLSRQTMMGLATQTDAVTTFNRGFCQAWCRNTGEGVGALMRGDCGSDGPWVFDGLVGGLFNGKDWCKQAIAKQNYELIAPYDGVAPSPAWLAREASH